MPMMNFIPCDGTDGCVPFVLPPRCPASAIQPAEMVGNGRRDGTARAPRFKRKTVKSLSPTLGIAGESPQHSEDLQRKARPKGERPNNHLQKLLLSILWKKEDRIFRSFVLMIYICNWTEKIAAYQGLKRRLQRKSKSLPIFEKNCIYGKIQSRL